MGLHPEPAAGMRGWAETQTWCANCPAQPRVRARHGEEKDTVRDLLAAGALLAGLSGHSAANRRQIRETLEKAKGAELSFFERFCAWGTRRSFFPARENRSRA